MEHYTANSEQKTEKKIWVTPELELITDNDILSGTFTGLPESLTAFGIHGTIGS